MFAFTFLVLVLLICLFVDYKKFKDDTTWKIKALQEQVTLSFLKKSQEETVREIKTEENKEYCESNTVAETEKETAQEEGFAAILPDRQTVKTQVQEGRGFEDLFMSDLFSKIGAVAVIIAIFIFLKVLSDMGIFTPVIKVVTGFVVGIGAVIASVKIHKENTKNYAEVLMGTGFAIMFITLYCGCSLLSVIPLWLGIVIGILLVSGTFFMAEKFNSFSTVAVGLIGGYINPFFTMTDVSVNFLFGYLLLLNAFSVFYVYKNTDKAALNYVNVILTAFIVFIGSFNSGKINYIYPLAFWGMYLINDLFYVKNERPDYELIKPLNYLNYILLIGFTCFIFNFDNRASIGLIVLATAVIYSACAYLCRNSEKHNLYLQGALLAVLISTYFLSEDIIRIAVLSAEAFCITYFVNKFDKKNLFNWIYVYYAAAFVFVSLHRGAFSSYCISGGNMISVSVIPEILMSKMVIFLPPAVSAFFGSKLIQDKSENAGNILKLYSLTYVYLFAVSLVNLIYAGGRNAFRTRCVIYSVIASLYSLNLQLMLLKAKSILFKVIEFIFYILSAVLLILSLSEFNETLPFLNLDSFAFCSLIIASLYKNKYSENDLFAYVSVLLGMLFVSFEIGVTKDINLSVIWSVYAGLIMLWGIFKNIKTLKICGIGIILLTIGKIFFIDLHEVSTVYKMMIFLFLGLSLLIVSYFYNRNKK